MFETLKTTRRTLKSLPLVGWLTGFVTLAIAFVVFSAQANAAEIRKVKIAIGQDFAPFEFLDEEGEVSGIVADTWRLWSEKSGIEMEFLPLPWAETLEAVKDAQADIHAGLNRNAERDTYLDFSRSIYATNVALFFPTGLRFSHKANNLAGFEVGVLKDADEVG